MPLETSWSRVGVRMVRWPKAPILRPLQCSTHMSSTLGLTITYPARLALPIRGYEGRLQTCPYDLVCA